ncbi:peptidase family M1-domain-containing protein [Cladochytrium replicatum]|nr:peptidase family M1-domain-containing protein [Cladochytrium replicatum]
MNVLPKNVKPVSYTLGIAPDLESLRFIGTVDIELEIVDTSDVIVVNALDLDVLAAPSILVRRRDGSEASFHATEYDIDEIKETLRMEWPAALRAGETAVLSIEFSGKITNDLRGFYSSSYINPDGKSAIMASTHFEPTAARRAFPCFDEPAIKAKFDISMRVRKDLVAISNMDVLREDVHDDGFKDVVFRTTVLQSTYIIAWALGDFEYIEDILRRDDGSELVVRVYATRGKQHYLGLALEMAIKALAFYENYFEIRCPLPKVDLAAIPSFPIGAMENFGLVTFRESAILFDPASSSAKTRERIASIVSHELSHFWFGNIVSLKWWTDVWLKEGAATYFSWLPVDESYPGANVWTSFIQGDYLSGKTADAMRTSHPIEVPVNLPSEIAEAFDSLSYSKGASLLRQIAAMLTPRTFIKGIQIYLKRHAFSNASTEDLWIALSEASGIDVKRIMDTWTKQSGYPLVEVVSESFNRSRGELTLNIRQNRFFSLGGSDPRDPSMWSIPLEIITDITDAPINAYLHAREGSVTFKYNPNAPNRFYKLNHKTTGFYTFRITRAILSRYIAILKNDPEFFCVEDRIGMLQDVFVLARSGLEGTSNYFDLALALKEDSTFAVLSYINTCLGSIRSVFYKEVGVVQDGLKKLVRLIFSAKVTSYDYPEGEDESAAYKRTTCIESAASAGDQSVVAELLARYNQWRSGKKSALNPNLIGIALSIAVEYSMPPADEFNNVLALYLNPSTVAGVRVSCLTALAATRDETLLRHLLTWALGARLDTGEEYCRSQDGGILLSAIAAHHPEFRETLFYWFTANFQALFDRYSSARSVLAAVLESCVQGNVGEKYINEFKEWLEEWGRDEKGRRQLDVVKSVRSSALERMQANTGWYDKDKTVVEGWIRGHM